ncbi:glycerol-3-phosphate acyltransferase 4 [Exaiptasia diaphana]|uniref:Phospholipid/glycerol acyltransferase domain-containing protein n=1 Tax=Exaiptasia diaphana TaxID=2652724 RepID=A0A913X8Z4_EXADI|nr:glycerol-3-phosphate acyltransferase 4 [Exaiptasia diaphana]KXJ14427.1 Glycerol-3-phosphate acyltransferase 4 [Exaiptasia diaphana]
MAVCILFCVVAYFLFTVLFIVVPGVFGFSLGLRNLYVKILLKVFEFGRKKIDSRQTLHVGNNEVIKREGEIFEPPKSPIKRNVSFGTFQRNFKMEDPLDFFKSGCEAIIDDEVTKRFSAAELESWNLLTRTNKNYHYVSTKLSIIWVLGFLFRYCILLPLRLTLVIYGLGLLTLSTAVLAQLPESNFRKRVDRICMLASFRILARALSAVITSHNKHNMAKGGGICVANHTSPIDVLILACENSYSMIGQRQPGLFGFIQKILAKSQDHIWFERFEMKDRMIVTKRLREHVEDPSKNPMLIFPEGTCINNTSVMMFKKGSFEIGGVIYPVAIKYDSTFGDAFWNSSAEGFGQYLLMLFTSWAIVCDVWYLEPMYKKENETSVQFANRVKGEIAQQGGLVDLIWDGQLKRMSVKPEYRIKRQEDYASTLKID